MKKVLFHIDEQEKWNMVLKNAQNMTTHFQQTTEEYQIEIVANGEAVKNYIKTNLALKQIMQDLVQQQVLFAACNHALQASELTFGDIFSFVTVVPVGVVEIAEKQSEGYAYIMP